VNFLQTFAAETAAAEEGNLFSALGIQWELLVLQIVAFIILVWLLGKFVYPYLMKSVDKRQADIEAAAKAAKEAQEAASDTQEETARIMAEARKEAADIVSTAKLEATELSANSEAKARSTAEKIVSEAHAQLSKDVEAAKRELHDQTLELVAVATGKVIGTTLDAKTDQKVIQDALKDAEGAK
jgi:F-type H+-transporting ATPase subunit b